MPQETGLALALAPEAEPSEGDWGIVYFTLDDPDQLELQNVFEATADEAMTYMYPTDTIVSAVVKWDGTQIWSHYDFSDVELALRTFD
jgi:hypothetical protein